MHDDDECARLASTLNQFFVNKIDDIQSSIDAALQSTVRREFPVRHHVDQSLSSFPPVSVTEVHNVLSAMPSKSSPLDVLPSSLLKTCADIFAPVIAQLAYLSFEAGKFPSGHKCAQVLPLLKKAGLDVNSPRNYRPISNLTTVSKVLERLVLTRLQTHLFTSPNYSKYQSAYRNGHSTETALLEILDGVYTAADDKQISVLVGLDLSAAFDTVNHSILVERLSTEFGIVGSALEWLTSYLTGRSQYVAVGQHRSDTVALQVGVPQGSVLGPLLFSAYTSPIPDIIAEHGVNCHLYADDNQLRLSMTAENTSDGLAVLTACTTDVQQWYLQNGLQLNPGKSEVMVIGTVNQLQATSSVTAVSVAGADLTVSSEMKVLGVTLDRRLSFGSYATSVARVCNFHAQAIRHIRHLLSTDLAATLACSLILPRLDYCNAVFHGTPAATIQTLQRVQNNAARIVLQTSGRTSAGPLLRQLHWLPVRRRIQYKLGVLTYKVRRTSTPSYLSCHLIPRVASRRLRSSTAPLLKTPMTRTRFADRAFRCAAPSVWNSLPADILNCATLNIFKAKLKTYLFSC